MNVMLDNSYRKKVRKLLKLKIINLPIFYVEVLSLRRETPGSVAGPLGDLYTERSSFYQYVTLTTNEFVVLKRRLSDIPNEMLLSLRLPKWTFSRSDKRDREARGL